MNGVSTQFAHQRGARERTWSWLSSELDVSRETLDRLDEFHSLLVKWQNTVNLISPDSVSDIWTRHILDSAQVVPLLPDDTAVCDLGSGAGFPGLVIACLRHDRRHVILIERTQKKCAFLREVTRTLGLKADVRCGDVVHLLPKVLMDPEQRIGALTSRALAPLAKLLDLSAPALEKGVMAVFHKGKTAEQELTEARQSWTIRATLHQSVTSENGRLVRILAAHPR